MRNIFRSLCLTTLTLGVSLLLAEVAFGASDMVQVALRSPGDLVVLLEQGLDVAYVSQGMVADVVIYNQEDRDRLNNTGLRYSVIQRDLESYFAQRLGPPRDDMGGYPTLAEIEEEMRQYHEDYPDLITAPIVFGETIEGRDMWGVVISDNPNEDENEPKVLLTSLIHAREPITVELILSLANMLLINYGEDERITRLVNEREIWLVPCVNPDGYFENERISPNGGGMWRKNKRRNNDGTIGVDLNRNFGFAWGYDDIGSSGRPGEQTYRGTGPFSEPETQAIRELVAEQHFAATMFFHSYGNLCLFPWGYDFLHAPDRAVLCGLTGKMVAQNQYLNGTGWEVIYLTNGETDDWIYSFDEENRILAFTIEIGTRQDNFWPPRNRVPALIQENLPSCLELIEYAEHPERVLPPRPPVEASYYLDPEGAAHLFWEPAADDDNLAVTYDVRAQLVADPIIDEIAGNDDLWLADGWYIYNFMERSDPYCYRVTTTNNIATLTYFEPMAVPDTLWAWLRMRIVGDENLALEVSEDNLSWTAVPGRNTREVIVQGYSHGQVLQSVNTNNAYERFWWNLRPWRGKHVWLRFRYYHFLVTGNGDYICIDDIGPMKSFSQSEIVAEGLEETSLILEDYNPDDGWVYSVRSVDAEGDRSVWSSISVEREAPPMMLLSFRDGWSMVSAPHLPDEPALENIFSPLVERDVLSLVKNGAGAFYAPRFDFNSIGDWDPLQGYLVKVDEETEMLFLGDRVPVDAPIPLRAGWNMIAYLPESPLPAYVALEGIVDHLELVKDGDGHFWTLEHDFSNMDDLQPGEGYLVRLNRAMDLVYTLERDQANFIHERSSKALIPPGVGGVNHSLLLELNTPLPTGTVAAQDREGNLCGIAEVRAGETQIGLAVWGEEFANEAGLRVGEAFQLFWRDHDQSCVLPLNAVFLEGDPNWQPDGFSVLAIGLQSAILPVESKLIGASPNPFNNQVVLTYSLNASGSALVRIFDISGREVFSKEINGLKTGAGKLSWDASDKPSGVYFARLDVAEKGRKLKFEPASGLKLLLVK